MNPLFDSLNSALNAVGGNVYAYQMDQERERQSLIEDDYEEDQDEAL